MAVETKITSKEIENILPPVYGARRVYVNVLFDTHQTHAVYGITNDEVASYKEHLKKLGAKKFRVVKNHYGRAILCFNANSMPAFN